MSDGRLQNKLDEILEQKYTYLIPGNIKNGVTILNITRNLWYQF